MLEDAIEKTVEDTLPKRGKLNQALQSIFIDDMDELLHNDREEVRRYKEKTVFGNDTPPRKNEDEDEDMSRSILIADNITIGDKEKRKPEPKKSSPIPLILAGLLGAAIPAAALPFLIDKQPQQQEFKDTDTRNDFELGFEGDYEVVK